MTGLGNNGNDPMKNGESLRETAVEGVTALSKIVATNDQLMSDNSRMQTDLALARQKINQLESRLTTAQTERDHFMNFSTELVARLSSIDMLIKNAVEEAGHAAFNTPLVPVPKAPVPHNTDGIEHLLKRLPVNGGATAHD